MIPSSWRETLSRLDGESPNDGDNWLASLGDLVGEYYARANSVPDEFHAFRLYQDALTLDRIRIQYARGEIDADRVAIWYEAGRNHLSSFDSLRTKWRR
jgi:hypothetical protein